MTNSPKARDDKEVYRRLQPTTKKEFSSVSVAYEKAKMPTRSKAISIQSDRLRNNPSKSYQKNKILRDIAKGAI